MPTRLTILVNDRAAGGLAAEHGLAAWVEHEGHAILFDTASSGRSLEANARALDIPIDEAEAVCLSHGHYDHTGGLPRLAPRLRGARLYAHPAAFRGKAARRRGRWQAIGSPVSPDELRAAGLELRVSAEPQEVVPGAWMSGEVEREARLVPATPHLFAETPAGRQVDPFADDQAMALCTEPGLVVLSGCAHAGIVNHCRAAMRLAGERRLRAVVGGFHLVGAAPGLIEATVEAFRRLEAQALHPCHCTGREATEALQAAFPDRCRPVVAGARLDF
ncbi:MAG: MBL fold metallo-hydrolase [Candidatus Brocadiia bacterium]